MINTTFNIDIQATPEYVWHALWNSQLYKKWTAIFSEGSYYAAENLNSGSTIHFLSPDGNGMYSKIELHIPNEKMYITHLGEVKNLEQLPLDENSVAWHGAKENYTLTHHNGLSSLSVNIDLSEKYKSFFDETFPKALEKVKQLAENMHLIVDTSIKAPISKVWQYFTEPAHIMQWNNASPDWHTPKAYNNLTVGGTFSYTMAAKDDSFSFDFNGTYTQVEQLKAIAYSLEDNRKVSLKFEERGEETIVTETFEPEKENTLELQQMGWQAILNNFKFYVEKN